MSNLDHGFNLVGICKGIKQVQSGQYTNTDLGIAVQRPDGFGGTSESLIYVSLFGESLHRLSQQVPNLIGKLVALPVVVQAKKSERTGNAYQRIFPHGNSNLIALVNDNQLKKVG
jgi:gamma DNA binding protein G5P